jgi:DNA-binding MarR family transcriptional regulator
MAGHIPEPDLETFAHAVRRFQARNCFVTQNIADHFGLLESHVVIEISADPDIELRELAVRLNISRESLRGVVGRLRRKGVIRPTSAQMDRRATALRLTAKGSRMVSEDDERADERMRIFEKAIGAAGIDALTTFCERVGRNQTTAQPAARANEHRLRRSVRWFTRAVGLFEDNLFHSTRLKTLDWYILSELSQNRRTVLARDLAAELAARKNTVSVAITKLEERGLLNRTPGPDAREKILQLTDAGRATARDGLKHAVSVYRQALLGFSLDEVRQFGTLVSRMIGAHYPIYEVIVRPRITVRVARTGGDLALAREFIVTCMHRDNTLRSMHHIVAPPDGITVIALVEENFCGAMDVLKNNGGQWHVNHLQLDETAAGAREDVVNAMLSALENNGVSLSGIRAGAVSTEVERIFRNRLAER